MLTQHIVRLLEELQAVVAQISDTATCHLTRGEFVLQRFQRAIQILSYGIASTFPLLRSGRASIVMVFVRFGHQVLRAATAASFCNESRVRSSVMARFASFPRAAASMSPP